MTALNSQKLTIYRMPAGMDISAFRARFVTDDKAGDFVAIAEINAQLVLDRARAQRKLGYADDFDTAGYFIARPTDLERATNLVTLALPSTKLTSAVLKADVTINVEDTTGFAATGDAYISDDLFTYTGKTGITFTGCSGLANDHLLGEPVTLVYGEDVINLLSGDDALKIGDRIKLNGTFLEVNHIRPESYRGGAFLYHYVFFKDVKTDEEKVDVPGELSVDAD